MSEILLLSGPPGAGKSTVAAQLVTAWPLAIHLPCDELYEWISSGYIEPWKPESNRQNRTVKLAAAAAAEQFAIAGYRVVVDGVLGPWFVGPWRSLGVPVHYVVLRPSLEATVHRASERLEHPLQDLEVVRQMHAAFADLEDLEHHAINSSDQAPEATTAAVLRRLDAGELILR